MADLSAGAKTDGVGETPPGVASGVVRPHAFATAAPRSEPRHPADGHSASASILDGMANPIPMIPPEGDRIWELIPTSWPVLLTSAPSELPRLIGASIWRKSSKLPSPSPVTPLR